MTEKNTEAEAPQGREASAVGAIVSQRPPMCHMRPMDTEWGDDGCQQVEYWICKHCGHTKEIQRYLAG